MNLNYQIIEENADTRICQMQFSLTSVKTDCFIEFRKMPEAITLLDITFPVNIPAIKIGCIHKLISEMNSNLITGKWHINKTEGCLGFSISYRRQKGSNGFDEDLLSYLQKGLTLVDFCTPGLLSVAFGNQEPEEVMREMKRGLKSMEN